ncbi:zinc finger protein 182-like [Drosophila ficusphila]|uniref:zinc finger protein 182-like n=1 Tax=Drosophila ficusphila TaxID=30025 RepID=UPI0007E688A1|nr:zinc finger protein 182-like [Drosophila ficusphila]
MEKTCRACLKLSVASLNIFKSTTESGTPIAEIISKCTGFQVCKGDQFPEEVCMDCLLDAKNAFEIKLIYEKSHKLYSQQKKDYLRKKYNLNCKVRIKRLRNSLVKKKTNDNADKDSVPGDIDACENHSDNNDNVSEGPLYKCSYCSKSFKQKRYLRRHLRIHTGEKPFQCSHCPKAFRRSPHLQCHLRTHTGERPYKCPNCLSAFSQEQNLKKHLRIHTGEREYKCSHCPNSFITKHQAEIHLLSHSTEIKFKCTHCPKAFKHPISRNNHERTHLKNPPHHCSACSKTFVSDNSLSYHLQTKAHKINMTKK